MTTYYRWNEQGIFIGSVEVDESGDLPLRSTPAAPPEAEEGQYLIWSGSEWLVSDEPPAEPEPDWAALVAARRYEHEVGGMAFGGIPIATDDRSKLLINGAASRASREADYTLRWKSGEGFIDLPAEQVILLADAVADFVQACFEREDVLLQAVADGSITAEMLNQGWPS